MTWVVWAQTLHPGNEQSDYWGSSSGRAPGLQELCRHFRSGDRRPDQTASSSPRTGRNWLRRRGPGPRIALASLRRADVLPHGARRSPTGTASHARLSCLPTASASPTPGGRPRSSRSECLHWTAGGAPNGSQYESPPRRPRLYRGTAGLRADRATGGGMAHRDHAEARLMGAYILRRLLLMIPTIVRHHGDLLRRHPVRARRPGRAGHRRRITGQARRRPR